MIRAIRNFWREVCRWVDAQERGARVTTHTSRWGNVRFVTLPNGRAARLASGDRKRLAKIAKREKEAAYAVGRVPAQRSTKIFEL